MTSIHDGIKALTALRDHYWELATATWVAGDYVVEGKYNMRAQEIGYAISHLEDALKIV
jgi:hypothetical protein